MPDRPAPGSKNFAQFYPHYLEQHQNRMNRRFHFLAGLSALLLLAAFLYTLHWAFLVAIPFVAYGFAWVGHFCFERNRPAALKNPFYSLLGEVMLFKEMLVGRKKF